MIEFTLDEFMNFLVAIQIIQTCFLGGLLYLWFRKNKTNMDNQYDNLQTLKKTITPFPFPPAPNENEDYLKDLMNDTKVQKETRLQDLMVGGNTTTCPICWKRSSVCKCGDKSE